MSKPTSTDHFVKVIYERDQLEAALKQLRSALERGEPHRLALYGAMLHAAVLQERLASLLVHSFNEDLEKV